MQLPSNNFYYNASFNGPGGPKKPYPAEPITEIPPVVKVPDPKPPESPWTIFQ